MRNKKRGEVKKKQSNRVPSGETKSYLRSKDGDSVPSYPYWVLSDRWIYLLPTALALLVYCNTLAGGFAYDDHRAILNNPDVVNVEPTLSGIFTGSQIWRNDFWGASLSRKGSHGSWRPFTTLSFRVNAVFAKLLNAYNSRRSSFSSSKPHTEQETEALPSSRVPTKQIRQSTSSSSSILSTDTTEEEKEDSNDVICGANRLLFKKENRRFSIFNLLSSFSPVESIFSLPGAPKHHRCRTPLDNNFISSTIIYDNNNFVPGYSSLISRSNITTYNSLVVLENKRSRKTHLVADVNHPTNRNFFRLQSKDLLSEKSSRAYLTSKANKIRAKNNSGKNVGEDFAAEKPTSVPLSSESTKENTGWRKKEISPNEGGGQKSWHEEEHEQKANKLDNEEGAAEADIEANPSSADKSNKNIILSHGWSFHLTNALLHSAVTFLYVSLLRSVYVNRLSCLIASVLFALHPVHCEVVASNVGRAELLSALFFCLSVKAYSKSIFSRHDGGKKCKNTACKPATRLDEAVDRCVNFGHQIKRVGPVFSAVAWASVGLLCKEQAITALGVSLSLHTFKLVANYHQNKQRSSFLGIFFLKLAPLSLSSALVGLIRLHLSPHTPTFTASDNPIAHEPNLLTRTLSIPKLWAKHIYLLVFPNTLTFDWSGSGAVPLVRSLSDPANFEVVFLAGVFIGVVWRCVAELCTKKKKFSPCSRITLDQLNNNSVPSKEKWMGSYSCSRTRKHSLGNQYEFNDIERRKHTSRSYCTYNHQIWISLSLMVIPFIPASNLLVWVGFTVAERVLYIPSMGYCLLVALGASNIFDWFHRSTNSKNSYNTKDYLGNRQTVENRSDISELDQHISSQELANKIFKESNSSRVNQESSSNSSLDFNAYSYFSLNDSLSLDHLNPSSYLSNELVVPNSSSCSSSSSYSQSSSSNQSYSSSPNSSSRPSSSNSSRSNSPISSSMDTFFKPITCVSRQIQSGSSSLTRHFQWSDTLYNSTSQNVKNKHRLPKAPISSSKDIECRVQCTQHPCDISNLNRKELIKIREYSGKTNLVQQKTPSFEETWSDRLILAELPKVCIFLSTFVQYVIVSCERLVCLLTSRVIDVKSYNCHGKYINTINTEQTSPTRHTSPVHAEVLTNRKISMNNNDGRKVGGATFALQWRHLSFYLALALTFLAMAGKTFQRNQNWFTDESLYSSEVKINPAKAYANLGVVYSESGRLGLAERAYNEALQHSPNMADTHYNLGLLFSRQQRHSEALMSYQKALSIRPWLVQGYLGAASALQELGRGEEAKKALEMCISNAEAPAKDGHSHSVTVVTCRERLARMMLLRKSGDKSIEELSVAIATAPPGYPVHSLLTLLGEAHLAAGDMSRAKDILKKILAAHPNHVPTMIAYSSFLKNNATSSKDIEEAESWLRKAVSVSPSDPHPHKLLGQLLLEQNKFTEAVEMWLRASSLDGSDAVTAFNTATALRLAGNNKEALKYYQLAVQLDPQDAASQRNLGASLHLLGRVADAKRHYLEALRLSPGDEQTLLNLRKIEALVKS